MLICTPVVGYSELLYYSGLQRINVRKRFLSTGMTWMAHKFHYDSVNELDLNANPYNFWFVAVMDLEVVQHLWRRVRNRSYQGRFIENFIS